MFLYVRQIFCGERSLSLYGCGTLTVFIDFAMTMFAISPKLNGKFIVYSSVYLVKSSAYSGRVRVSKRHKHNVPKASRSGLDYFPTRVRFSAMAADMDVFFLFLSMFDKCFFCLPITRYPNANVRKPPSSPVKFVNTAVRSNKGDGARAKEPFFFSSLSIPLFTLFNPFLTVRR